MQSRKLDTGILLHEAIATYQSLGFKERAAYHAYPETLMPYFVFMELPLAGSVAMALWLLMLISQAFLIRTDRRTLHRLAGRASYVLVPLIVLSTLSLAHLRVRESGNELPAELLYFLYIHLGITFPLMQVVTNVLVDQHVQTPALPVSVDMP